MDKVQSQARWINIKQNFETVVRENTAWLLSFVKSHIRNKDLAEDLVQEIWIKAFHAYESYYDNGKLKPWLSRIAQNYLHNYYSKNNRMQFVSLDAVIDNNDSLYCYLSSGNTPEDEYIQKEIVSEVLDVIGRLPDQQRQVVTYQFFDDFAVNEIAQIMRLPQGTVKSKTHYALARIRKQLGNNSIKSEKGASVMECKDIHKYLFMYAKGTLAPEDKEIVRDHLSKCSVCNDIVTALQKLIPTMTFAKKDERSHFIIDFPNLCFSIRGAQSVLRKHA